MENLISTKKLVSKLVEDAVGNLIWEQLDDLVRNEFEFNAEPIQDFLAEIKEFLLDDDEFFNELKDVAKQRFENEISIVQTNMDLFDFDDVVIDARDYSEDE